MSQDPTTEKKPARSKFPPLYWLVVIFEFFERGSYYGVMSVLSVYLTDVLKFAKEDVGVIKGTIQPLLYFLPIVSGALADRFGYRRALLVAFTLLGTGYFITARMTSYPAVFLALVVMGLGAGTFKPIISGTIARCTDSTNSTLGFGIFYWSINLGAFVVPLFLVPYLKNNVGWQWVLYAAAMGTGAMLLPTLLAYHEPPAPLDDGAKEKPPLLQTLANAFEIIYSPFILLHARLGSAGGKALLAALLLLTLGLGSHDFLRDHQEKVVLSPGKSEQDAGERGKARKTPLVVRMDRTLAGPFQVSGNSAGLELALKDETSLTGRAREVLGQLRERGAPDSLDEGKLNKTAAKALARPFLPLFVGLLLVFSLAILRVAPGLAPGRKGGIMAGTCALMYALLWGCHALLGLSLFATLLCSVISLTLLSLFAINTADVTRFSDHGRFLLMIFIYSGFWVLYFQMFDSVLWYVQSYVDATSLDSLVNGVLAAVGVSPVFQFDVEHVTVINAGTIILLQLPISSIVKNTRALPTMVTGIAIATVGMGILAVSSGIWVFLAGIAMFSIGEMTAHPKFISYVGQTAPKSRVAMYMGYLFLYGVIGSSIGSPLGANLYVKFVDELDQPRTLWLIFTGIGVCTIFGLLLYNRFFTKTEEAR